MAPGSTAGDGQGSVILRLAQLLGITALQALLLFGSAGTFQWPAAWWYLGLYVVLLVIAAAVLRSRREVIAERSKGTRGALRWDRVLTRLVAVTSLAVLVVAGLAVRFCWSPQLGMPARIVGVAAFVLGYSLVLWAMAVNRFFAQGVRIQSERAHVTVTAGPYQYVRHPGYLGMLVSIMGAVALLGSPWALIPAASYAAVMVTRTQFEDRTLAQELPGYREYRRTTRSRLIPGVW